MKKSIFSRLYLKFSVSNFNHFCSILMMSSVHRPKGLVPERRRLSHFSDSLLFVVARCRENGEGGLFMCGRTSLEHCGTQLFTAEPSGGHATGQHPGAGVHSATHSPLESLPVHTHPACTFGSHATQHTDLGRAAVHRRDQSQLGVKERCV